MGSVNNVAIWARQAALINGITLPWTDSGYLLDTGNARVMQMMMNLRGQEPAVV